MHMVLVVIARTVMLTQLIIQVSSSILECMHYIMLKKQREDTEDTRLVHIEKPRFKTLQTHRAMKVVKGLKH